MTTLFENNAVDMDQLPQVSHEAFIGLEKRFKSLLLTRSIIFFVILSAFLLTLFFIKLASGEFISELLYMLIPIVLLWALSIAVIWIGFPHKAYLLRQHDILYKTGYLIRRMTAVPKNRIQHVEIRQGVLSRMFKLSRLIVFTAGGNASDLSIPGLRPETAQQLKEHISKSISEHE